MAPVRSGQIGAAPAIRPHRVAVEGGGDQSVPERRLPTPPYRSFEAGVPERVAPRSPSDLSATMLRRSIRLPRTYCATTETIRASDGSHRTPTADSSELADRHTSHCCRDAIAFKAGVLGADGSTEMPDSWVATRARVEPRVDRDRPIHRLLSSALVLCTSLAVVSGCGGNRRDQAANVREACNRLEVLSRAVLSVRSATTSQEVQAAVEKPLSAFVSAADRSGDRGLADLGHTYDSRLSTYLTAEGINARAAGNDANIALDRAGERCSELGATNNFPQQS